MQLPTKQRELLFYIAKETARMSYPGSMSRGKKPVVRKDTKKALENYFCKNFPMEEVWGSAKNNLADTYDKWHRKRVEEISDAIGPYVSSHNQPLSVSAKFLNTFMHQLMKYEPTRPLFSKLHLPLDSRVFSKFRIIQSSALKRLTFFNQSPYAISYDLHGQIQKTLWEFIDELNARPDAEFSISSRIELNWLWL
jgi:hypothetical protein